MNDMFMNVLTWVLILSGLLGWLSIVIAGFYIWLTMEDEQ